jgi:hypothetical protein
MTPGSPIPARACPASACCGYELDGATTGLTGFDIAAEYSFETPSPRHGGMACSDGLVMYLIERGGLAALATPVRGDQCPVFTVGCEITVKSGQVDAGFGDEGGDACDEVQGLEDHLGRSSAPGGSLPVFASFLLTPVSAVRLDILEPEFDCSSRDRASTQADKDFQSDVASCVSVV